MFVQVDPSVEYFGLEWSSVYARINKLGKMIRYNIFNKFYKTKTSLLKINKNYLFLTIFSYFSTYVYNGMLCTVQYKTEKFMCPALISEQDNPYLKLKMVPYSFMYYFMYLKNRKSYLVVKGNDKSYGFF